RFLGGVRSCGVFRVFLSLWRTFRAQAESRKHRRSKLKYTRSARKQPRDISQSNPVSARLDLVRMVVIILITVTTPAIFVFVPPLPAVSPAPLANLAEFTAPVICLPAVESVVHDSLVEFVLGVRAAPGAIVIMAGGTRQTRKHKHGRQGCSGQQFPCYNAD